jgi:hypothetical protein
VTKRADFGLCPCCKQITSRVFITVEGVPTRGVKVCPDCLAVPGVQFRVDVPDRDPFRLQAQHSRLRLSRNGEKRTAAEVGGQRTKASGATHDDADIKTPNWLIEEKTSRADSYTLTAKIIAKLAAQANRLGKDWVIKLRLPRIGSDIAVMRWESILSELVADKPVKKPLRDRVKESRLRLVEGANERRPQKE